MVTQQRMRQLKKNLSNTIKLVNDFITPNERNIAFANNIHKKPMIDQLNLFSNELTDYGDTISENDENDKLLEQYEETKTEAEATPIRSQTCDFTERSGTRRKRKTVGAKVEGKRIGNGTKKQRETTGDKC